MRLLGRVMAVVVCLACGVVAARAEVGDYVGRPVAGIEVQIEARATVDDRLLSMIETRVGQALSMAAVRESVTHLYSTGRFEDVRVHAWAQGSSVMLRYELVPIHRLEAIEFAGGVSAPGVSASRLREAVRQRFGNEPAIARLKDVAVLVADSLKEAGYLHPTVTPQVRVEHAPERALAVLAIEAGPRTNIGTIDLAGDVPASRADFLGRLDLEPGKPFELIALGARIERYIGQLRSRGYYEAKVDLSSALVDDDRVANLTLTVRPGPHVRVEFAGDALPQDRRADLVPVEREGSTDESLLEDATNRIEDALRAQGYRDAVAPHTREEAHGELLIRFTVNRGPLYRVAAVDLAGNADVPASDIAPGLRSKGGELFSASRLAADVSAIEDLYRRRGFSSVRVQPSVDRDEAASPAGGGTVAVRIRIAIREGVRTLVGAVTVDGNHTIGTDTLRKALALDSGRPWVPGLLAADRDAIQSAYANVGYPGAVIEARTQFSPDSTRVDVAYTIREGSRVLVDHILIVGNERVRTAVVEKELLVKTGDPLSVAAVNESQRRLAQLGLFRRVRITEVGHGDEDTRDLLVTLEEAPAITIGYGGGGEVRLRVVANETGAASQQIEFAPRGSFEIGRRNLFGRNRSINLFTSLSLHPADSTYYSGTTATTTSTDTGTFGFGLAEYRVLSTYREPHALGTPFDAQLTGVVEQQIRSSYNFARRSATVDFSRAIGQTLRVSGSYQLQSTRVFDENLDPSQQPLVDRVFPQVRLSSFITSVVRDTKNDAVDPTAGHYLAVNGQLAARSLGSEVGFAKTFMTAETFRPLPRGIVFAGAARLGLAQAFPRPLADTADQIEALPVSERFFAGGDTTVRGFALDTLGTPATIDQDGFPIGGNGLVIFNGEFRIPVRGGLGVVAFLDTGNVFARVSDINLSELRSAAGFGIRYKSPVGPLRIDLGFKLNRQTLASGQREALTAFHISFGQAF